MGHHTVVYAIRPPDAAEADRFLKMKAVWDACNSAGVSVPAEVRDFIYDSQEPEEEAILLSIGSLGRELRLYSRVCDGIIIDEGYEVDLDKLPAGTKVIRFVCRWS